MSSSKLKSVIDYIHDEQIKQFNKTLAENQRPAIFTGVKGVNLFDLYD